ncbi:class I SAM-dependent methyltransferase [Pseudoxanthomonas mexicana]|uniref:class I SAM-dependent methyltransferase n=1 Tax=Pseudoxanthomonas mexicana TaxID=128785 RepID=UPI00398A9B4C
MSLYDRVTALHGDLPWGAVLDAGTGRSSMQWLLQRDTPRWTAVTGSQAMAEATRREAGDRIRPQDRVVVGNWSDPRLLDGERYDTVLADYLLGAIEGFAPYTQDRLFERLRPLVGGRLYVIGLEPYVPYAPSDPDGRLVVEIGRLRDACLLMAGDHPYREYPLDWTLRQLARSGFRVVDAERIAIRYGERFVHSQLDMCTHAAGRFHDRALAVAMLAHVADLRARALAHLRREGGLRHGHDYVVVAEPGT